VHLGDGVLIRLKENSVFKVEKLRLKKSALRISLRLIAGKALVKIVKRLAHGSRLRVRTPTAVLAVRGTTFIVDIQAAKTEIKVLEGVVRAAAAHDVAGHTEEFAGQDVGAGQETGWAQEAGMLVVKIPDDEAPDPEEEHDTGGEKSA
jgi:hypothetical protein